MQDADRPLALRIAAPPRVALDLRQSAPILAYHAAPLQSLGKETFANSAVLTAVCIETNHVFTGRVRVGQQPQLPSGSRRDPEKVCGIELYYLDMRKCLGIPWSEATYFVTLIMQNAASNRIRVSVAKSDWLFRDPEVEKFLAARRRLLAPLPVWPLPATSPAGQDQALPWYRRLPASPEVPSTNGIALKAVPPATIYGSFRLSVAGGAIAHPNYDKFSFLRTTAILPIALVLASDTGGFQINLRVPSFSEIDPSEKEKTANGFFAVDLNRLDGVPNLPSRFFAYAFSGETMVGPVSGIQPKF